MRYTTDDDCFMDTKHSIKLKSAFTIVEFKTIPTYDDLKSAINEIAETDRSSRRMWVYSGGFDLPSKDLQRIAEYANRTLAAPSKSAMVCSDDLGYGLLRVLEVHRDQTGHSLRVFRTEAKAVTWLELPF